MAEAEAVPVVWIPRDAWRDHAGAAHLAAAPSSFCRRLIAHSGVGRDARRRVVTITSLTST